MAERSYSRLPHHIFVAVTVACACGLVSPSVAGAREGVAVTLLLRSPGGGSGWAVKPPAALVAAPSLRQRRALRGQPLTLTARFARLQALRRHRAFAAVMPSARKAASGFLPA